MLTLVAGGLGVSHLPEEAIRVGFGGVVALTIEPPVMVTLHAARAANRHAPLIDDFLALLRVS